MRVDLYTKIILTIIAICLLFLASKTFQPVPATATNEIIRVDLARIDGKHIWKLEEIITDAIAKKAQSVFVESGYIIVGSSHEDPVHVEITNPW